MEKILDCQCHKVNKLGEVFSCLVQTSQKGKQGIQTIKTNEWKKMESTLTKSGYLQTVIHKKIWRVNRLIATIFIKNSINKPEVHHINGVRTDNRLENLRWGDQKQNAKDRFLHGNSVRGSKSPNSKLTEEKVKEIRQLRPTTTLQFLADKYNVSKKLILLVIQNKIWKHI